jgi:hypothetical protein
MHDSSIVVMIEMKWGENEEECDDKKQYTNHGRH